MTFREIPILRRFLDDGITPQEMFARRNRGAVNAIRPELLLLGGPMNELRMPSLWKHTSDPCASAVECVPAAANKLVGSGQSGRVELPPIRGDSLCREDIPPR